MTRPTFYEDIYLLNASAYLPGNPVSNEQIDDYIAPLAGCSGRIKRRILSENGIRQRHYAIDKDGKTQISHTDMACQSVTNCLEQAHVGLEDIDLLTAATSGGDVLMPGMANMVQGQLHAPPMETHSHQGICASSVLALKDAAQNLTQNTAQKLAISVAAEMPSRMFKRSRFASQAYKTDFESAFLRWMLSDGAGSVLLGKGETLRQQINTSTPLSRQKLALKLDWIHAKSFSGDYPVCMQLGQNNHRREENSGCKAHGLSSDTSFLDFPNMNEAEAAGHFSVRQNLRLLPNLFDIAVHEYAELVNQGYINPVEIDTFLCHYSSEALGKTCENMMQEAGLGIPRERWFNTLQERGNTGAASIFIMLADLLQAQSLCAGQKILGFVPESGRFTVSYFMLTVENIEESIGRASAPLSHRVVPPDHLAASSHAASSNRIDASGDTLPSHTRSLSTSFKNHGAEGQNKAFNEKTLPLPPHAATNHYGLIRDTLLELANIWHEYRSEAWRTPLIRKINEQRFTANDYTHWMAQWIPQVREGSLWMRRAVESLDEEHRTLAELITHHADDEQHDFKILFEDYQLAGGQIPHIDQLQRNPGGEALNSYMYNKSATPNPLGLLGGIYIIEGTGQRIVPWLLPQIKQQLKLPERCYRFLHYHGENDQEHLQHWLFALEIALELGGETAHNDIIRTARDIAALYRMQMEHIL